MKSKIREILTDIRAAAWIGHPDSIDSAMDGLGTFPEVTSNQLLEEHIIEQLVLPAARILNQSSVTTPDLYDLSADPVAAIRAIYTAALGLRMPGDKTITPNILREFANDKRADVRKALSLSLIESGSPSNENYLSLIREWLTSHSIRLQETAINALPTREHENPQPFLNLLSHVRFSTEHQIRRAIADKLIEFNQKGYETKVFSLLQEWANDPEPSIWVITRVLKHPSSSGNESDIKNLLFSLRERIGDNKEISNALKSLGKPGKS